VRLTREAFEQYGMVEPGGKWLFAMSGGNIAINTTFLRILHELPMGVGSLPVELMRGQPREPKVSLNFFQLRSCCFSSKKMGLKHRIEYQDTYSIVMDKNPPQAATFCGVVCSRLRRGHLYRIAREEGCNRRGSCHHRDDILRNLPS